MKILHIQISKDTLELSHSALLLEAARLHVLESKGALDSLGIDASKNIKIALIELNKVLKYKTTSTV